MNPNLRAAVVLVLGALGGFMMRVNGLNDADRGKATAVAAEGSIKVQSQAPAFGVPTIWSDNNAVMPAECGSWSDKTSERERASMLNSDEFKQWAALNPKEALALALRFSSEQHQSSVIKSVISELIEYDLMTARNLVDALPNGSSKSMAGKVVAEEMAKRDPQAALDYASSFSNESGLAKIDEIDRSSLRGMVISTISRLDNQRAVEFVELLPRSKLRDQLAGSLSWEWMSHDPERAAEYALRNQQEEQDGSWGDGGVIYRWAQLDPIAVGNWIKKLPDGRDRDAAMLNLFNLQTTADIDLVMELVSKLQNEISQVVAVRITSSLSDVETAIDLSEKIPHEVEIEMAEVKGSESMWEFEQNYTWLDSMPAGDIRDSALKGAAKSHMKVESAVAAMDYAASISNEAQKARTLRRLGNVWMLRDPEAATQWINSSPAISDSLRRDLLMRD